MTQRNPSNCGCGVTRRSFLADTGMGFTGLALGAMLFGEGTSRALAAGAAGNPNISNPDSSGPKSGPHLKPRAKNVIWIFPLRRRQPRRELRSQARVDSIRGQVDRCVHPYKDVLNPEKLSQDIVSGNPAHGGRRILMG
jgi:hypothetical protein